MKELQFGLKIVRFDPALVFDWGWKLESVVYGPRGNDGISAFQSTIEKASLVSKDEARNMLFASGLSDGNTVVKGEDKIKALSNVNHADPDLIYSLYIEEGQQTLRYLYETYGITWMESLRRIIFASFRRCSLYLFRKDDGSWSCGYHWLNYNRDLGKPALVLTN